MKESRQFRDVCVYMYMFIYRERERDNVHRERIYRKNNLLKQKCWDIYISVCIKRVLNAYIEQYNKNNSKCIINMKISYTFLDF